VTAPEKAESALHRGGYVMNTGAAFPPDLSALATELGPLVTHPGRPVIASVEAAGEVLEAGSGRECLAACIGLLRLARMSGLFRRLSYLD